LPTEEVNVSQVVTGQVDVVRVNLPDEATTFAIRPGGLAGPGGTLPTTLIIRLNAETGEITGGGIGRNGTLRLFTAAVQETITLDGAFGNLRLGGNGADGDVLLFATDADRNNPAAASIHLDGQSGDIILRNADCAEEFEVADAEAIEAGSIVSLADDGKLQLARHPYDRKVAGIVSGAGDSRPGIVLARDPTRRNRVPIALVGRVHCRVDADYAPVEVGDLLTTSATPGHAMRADDATRAFGSVIGKAMGSLRSGAGLVPVLVALQ
jgi:hypothetical protein